MRGVPSVKAAVAACESAATDVRKAIDPASDAGAGMKAVLEIRTRELARARCTLADARLHAAQGPADADAPARIARALEDVFGPGSLP
jgi:hypothetical protein